MEHASSQLGLRATCPVGGRPGAILVAPDASRFFVLDQEEPWATEAGLLRMERLGGLDFAPHAAAPLRVLGRAGDRVALAGAEGGLAIFDLGARAYVGSIQGGGPVGDFLVAPGGRLALLSLGSGGRGSVELVDLERWESRELLSLPGDPVPGTMTLSPKKDRGAVLASVDGGRGRVAVTWWTSTFRTLEVSGVPPDASAVAFAEGGQVLAVASPASSEVILLDLGTRRERARAGMVGCPFHLSTDPAGRHVWALCASVGHVAVLDPAGGKVVSRVLLEGVDPAANRVAFSPEGRLAAVAEGAGGGVVLLDADPASPGYGLLLDRLELGRVLTGLAWSPLGDEIVVGDAMLGAAVALTVDRGSRLLKDTDEYLLEHLRERMELERRKNPLFPP